MSCIDRRHMIHEHCRKKGGKVFRDVSRKYTHPHLKFQFNLSEDCSICYYVYTCYLGTVRTRKTQRESQNIVWDIRKAARPCFVCTASAGTTIVTSKSNVTVITKRSRSPCMFLLIQVSCLIF